MPAVNNETIGHPAIARPAVVRAVNDWLDQRKPTTPQLGASEDYPANETILHSLPQRQRLISADAGRSKLPYYEMTSYQTSFWKSLRRLFTWLRVLFGFMTGNLADKITRKSTPERQAVRLREALERAGGTFVKYGQQAAMRIDLLPWAYCVELSKMLDRMQPFPVEQAIANIERTLGRPWQDVFEVFDPVPVGSASIACIYQATLKGGDKVVVKVRRPKIVELFLADLKVLDWICELAEFLTLLRPGFTRNLRMELRETLMEELDFKREARFQDTFRRNAKKSGQDFFTSPHVYFDLSGEEILVQEFVTGLWLWEVIAAIENKDPSGRALLARLNIDPVLVGRRILWAEFWSSDEHVFFHADPHPANILVRRNSELTFIDFGSCGSFNNEQRMGLEQMILSMNRQDVEGMTRGMLTMMEPLPPVDIPAMVKHANEEYMRLLQTFNTPAKYTEYWERTSARQWIVILNTSRKFNIPLNLHTLRMIRATLLYDSIVLRLDNTLDRYDEYNKWMKDRAQLVKKKWRSKMRDAAGDNLFLGLDELSQSFNDLLLRSQTTLGRPILSLGFTVGKGVYTVGVLSRMLGRILLVTLLGMALVYILHGIAREPVSFSSTLSVVTRNTIYQIFLLCVGLFSIRNIFFRLRDRDA